MMINRLNLVFIYFFIFFNISLFNISLFIFTKLIFFGYSHQVTIPTRLDFMHEFRRQLISFFKHARHA